MREIKALQAEFPWTGPAKHRLDVGKRDILLISRPMAANAAIRDVPDSNLAFLFDTAWPTWEVSMAGRRWNQEISAF